MSKQVGLWLCLILCVVVLGSCTTIALDARTSETGQIEKAVYMSSLGTPDFYTVVDSFSVNDRAGWILGLVPVNKPAGGEHNYLRKVLEDQIALLDGDGVIDVRVRIHNRIIDVMSWLVPIYTVRTVTVSGTVIKYD